MGDELGATLVRRSGALAIRRGASRVAGQAVAVLGTSLAVVVAGVTCTWALSGPLLVSAGALAAWVAALVLVVAVLVLLAHRGRHSAWFHPLSIPFATIAIMSLGAPLWVFFTHQAVGLLYDAGYEPRDASPLAAAVSVTACEALALVVIGYLIGISMALALSKSAESASESKAGSTFRYREMRNAGFILMALGAVSQMAVAILTSGVPYGVNQFQYGLPSILSPGAATALLADNPRNSHWRSCRQAHSSKEPITGQRVDSALCIPNGHSFHWSATGTNKPNRLPQLDVQQPGAGDRSQGRRSNAVGSVDCRSCDIELSGERRPVARIS